MASGVGSNSILERTKLFDEAGSRNLASLLKMANFQVRVRVILLEVGIEFPQVKF